MDVVPPHITYEPYSSYFDKLGNKMNYIHICNNDGKKDVHLRLDYGRASSGGYGQDYSKNESMKAM